MPPPRGKGRGSKDKRPKRNTQSLLFRRKRFCRFTVANVESIDYKEIDVLRDFVGENGRITPARLTGTRAFSKKMDPRPMARWPWQSKRLVVTPGVSIGTSSAVTPCAPDSRPCSSWTRRWSPMSR